MVQVKIYSDLRYGLDFRPQNSPSTSYNIERVNSHNKMLDNYSSLIYQSSKMKKEYKQAQSSTSFRVLKSNERGHITSARLITNNQISLDNSRDHSGNRTP